MIKICPDCGKSFKCLNRNYRCKECQRIYRLEYLCIYHKEWWQDNKHHYFKRWITRLGGLPITLKEIRDYKGGVARNSSKGNAAYWIKDAKTYYTEEEYYEED